MYICGMFLAYLQFLMHLTKQRQGVLPTTLPQCNQKHMHQAWGVVASLACTTVGFFIQTLADWTAVAKCWGFRNRSAVPCPSHCCSCMLRRPSGRRGEPAHHIKHKSRYQVCRSLLCQMQSLTPIAQTNKPSTDIAPALPSKIAENRPLVPQQTCTHWFLQLPSNCPPLCM